MFNFRKRPTAWAVLISLLLFSPALFAADFTFNVPVKLTNLHEDVSEGYVECIVSRKLSPNAHAREIIGHSLTDLIVTEGSVEGAFTVSVNPNPNQLASSANYWQCKTKLCDNRLNFCGILTPNNEISSFRSAPDSNVVMEYSGSL